MITEQEQQQQQQHNNWNNRVVDLFSLKGLARLDGTEWGATDSERGGRDRVWIFCNELSSLSIGTWSFKLKNAFLLLKMPIFLWLTICKNIYPWKGRSRRQWGDTEPEAGAGLAGARTQTITVHLYTGLKPPAVRCTDMCTVCTQTTITL